MRAKVVSVADELVAAVGSAADPIPDIETVNLTDLLRRIGDARLVLLGEASHGTSEFYQLRQRITRELIEREHFRFVAVEADWPDAALVDAYVRRGRQAPAEPGQAFSRFPSWMWRNLDVLEFVEWLRVDNDRDPDLKVAFHGLDLYSLSESMAQVLEYLEKVDPRLADIARERYACLTPYALDPQAYGLAAVTNQYRECEDDVVAILKELQARRGEYLTGKDEAFLDAEQNARVAQNAEQYYRAMYYAGAESWNIRDQHMFDTLQALMEFHGPTARGVVWAHNSHLGNARATSMAARGEYNLGQLVRQAYGDAAYAIGFGTDHGTVTAAPHWGGEAETMEVRPAHPKSYERLFHTVSEDAFFLPLREKHAAAEVRDGLFEERLERAIGVIYRPRTELASHYFAARLPAQFDEYCWFDASTAVVPLAGAEHTPLEPGHPFAALDI
jgi:protein-L-isoaspartate(D-aspartate) O-methyltransferase